MGLCFPSDVPSGVEVVEGVDAAGGGSADDHTRDVHLMGIAIGAVDDGAGAGVDDVAAGDGAGNIVGAGVADVADATGTRRPNGNCRDERASVWMPDAGGRHVEGTARRSMVTDWRKNSPAGRRLGMVGGLGALMEAA